MRRCSHVLLICAVVLIATLAARPAVAGAPEPPAVAWTALGQGRVVTWDARGELVLLRSVEVERGVELAPGEVLLVPVDAGDALRSAGEVLLGLASGSDAMPDTITWWPATPRAGATEARELRVPTWSSARFLAIRSTLAVRQHVQLSVARAASDPLAWHRFDAAVASWLFDGVPLTQRPPPQASVALRQVETLERTLGRLAQPVRAPWLMTRWLELSLRLRPLTSPYFARAAVAPVGGTSSSAKPDADAALEYRELRAGQELVFSDIQADVLRLELRATATTPTRIAIFEGETLSRVVEVDGRAKPMLQRSQSVRAVVPVTARRVRLRLLEGSSSVGFAAFVQRVGVLDAVTLRQSRAHNAVRVRSFAAGASAPWLAWLSDVMGLANERSCERLASVATVDPGLRALLVFESARCAATPEAVLSSLAALRAGLAALPAASQATLERGALQRLVDVGASRADSGTAVNAGGHPEDRLACETLVATLSVAPEAGVLQRAERAAASSPERADLVQLARRAWLRASVWSALLPSKPAVTRLRAAVPAEEPGNAGRCAVHTGAGLRWTVLDAGTGELVVGSSGGSHSHVLLRLEPGDTREVALKLGGVPLTVHAAAGLMGHVALAPGAHRVEVAAGNAVLARAPREGLVTCAELRELERWSLASAGAGFELTPADVNQPIRLTVMEQSLGGRARELSVLAGGQRYVAWVRPPASGSIELPRAAGIPLQARSTAPLEVRASVRQPRVPTPEARVVARRPEQASPSEEQLLQRLRETTRRLDAAGDASARAAAHLERAELLTALGAARLADMERLRAGSLQPSADVAADGGYALRFPQHTAPALVLGLASQIPPLGAARDPVALARARRLQEQDEPPAVIAEALSRAATGSSGADALLLASAAERAGLPGVAADAYERIAHAAQSGAALARAATLLADTAAARADSALAFRAYRLALRASEQGDAAGDALGRLGPTVSWLSASSAGSGTGSLLLAHSGPSATESLGTRIRRALLDAHADSVLLREGRRLELHSDQPLPSELELSLSCVALEPSGACQALLEVDGRKLPCTELEQPSSSFRARCHVSLPPGRHRVDLSLAEAGGAAMAVHVTRQEQTVHPRVVSSWTELDAAHPLELRVFGPTVLRIASRVEANRAQRIALELGSESGSERRVWDIPASSDPAVQRPGTSALSPAELGSENELLWVVDKAGEQQLRLAPEQGRTLVRLSAAYGSGLPRPRELEGTPSASPLPIALHASEAALPQRSPFGFDAVEGPLTLNATLSVQQQDMTESEGERSHLHQELRVSALRELWRSRAYGSASLIYRARQGANSRGALGTLSASARGAVPGLFARGLVMQQDLPTGVATGWYGIAGLLWDLPLASGAELSPWANVIGRHAAAVSEPTPNLDADVSSRYSRLQTLSLESGLRFDTRPFVDTLATYGVSARYGPYYSAIDRADVSVSLDTLPGGGLFPWISAWGSVSHRPTSSIRETPFTRTSLGAQVSFWTWSGGREHWRLFGRVLQFVDWPARDQTLSFALGASVDATFRRGLRDYAPRSVPFRARQEEGSARVQRQSPAREPAWELER